MKIRTLICFLFAVICAVLITRTQVSAADTIVASGDWAGGNVIWSLSEDGTLTLKGPRHMEGATTSYPWARYADQIQKIVFEDGLTSIAKNAFTLLPNLTSVQFNNTITKIEDRAFSNCPKLQTIYLNENIEELGDMAFIGCESLTSVTFAPHSKLSQFGSNVFSNCSSLTSVTFPLHPKFTEIPSGTFFKCPLTSIDIPAGIKTIGDSAFANCEQLAHITLPEGLERVGKYAFQYCYKLTKLTIPSTVKSLTYSFYYCTGLKELELYANVNYTKSFKGCPIKSVVYLGNLTTISDDSFDGCSSLASVTFPDSVVTIGRDAFRGCAIREITLPKNLKTIGSDAFNSSKLISITLPDSVETVERGAFRYCPNLTSFTAGSNLRTLSAYIFEYCPNLTYVSLKNITAIGSNAFLNCNSLAYIALPEVLESIGDSAFFSCESLVSIKIPASVKVIEQTAFADCTSLKTVVFAGSAPSLNHTVFYYRTICAYYPKGDPSWSADILQDYEGKVTWIASSCDESHAPISLPAVLPTCTQSGLTEGSVCGMCGSMLSEQQTVNALGHDFGSWSLIEPPEDNQLGLYQRSCYNCDLVEQRHMDESEATDPTEPPSQPSESTKPSEPSAPTPEAEDGLDLWIWLTICGGAILLFGAVVWLILKRK